MGYWLGELLRQIARIRGALVQPRWGKLLGRSVRRGFDDGEDEGEATEEESEEEAEP